MTEKTKTTALYETARALVAPGQGILAGRALLVRQGRWSAELERAA